MPLLRRPGFTAVSIGTLGLGTPPRRRTRKGSLRDTVVVLEVALGLTLLIGAGLLMRSFVALRDVNLGLRPGHVFQAVRCCRRIVIKAQNRWRRSSDRSWRA